MSGNVNCSPVFFFFAVDFVDLDDPAFASFVFLISFDFLIVSSFFSSCFLFSKSIDFCPKNDNCSNIPFPFRSIPNSLKFHMEILFFLIAYHTDCEYFHNAVLFVLLNINHCLLEHRKIMME